MPDKQDIPPCSSRQLSLRSWEAESVCPVPPGSGGHPSVCSMVLVLALPGSNQAATCCIPGLV